MYDDGKDAGYDEAWRDAEVEIERLKGELRQQRFNNAHNLSIDQQIADEVERLNNIIVIQREAIEALRHTLKSPISSQCSVELIIQQMNQLLGPLNIKKMS